MKLPKTHFFDAVAIASQAAEVKFFENIRVVLKKSVSKGNDQLSKGKRNEKRINTGKICGFRKFDKILFMVKNILSKDGCLQDMLFLWILAGKMSLSNPSQNLYS